MAEDTPKAPPPPAGDAAAPPAAKPAAPPEPPAAKAAPPPKAHEPPGNPTMAATPAERVAASAAAAQVKASPPPAPPAAAPAAAAEGVTRRGFFSWAAVGWVGFAAAIGGCMTAFGRFMYPNVLYEPPTNFKVGRPEDFPKGVVDERYKESNGVWIVNLGDRLVALIAVCTHLGCPPAWLEAQNKFKCPCHGSGYYRTGINFEGPTPRPLERAAISVDPEDGQIVVDKARRYQWERGQWEDPASFIVLA
jgi:cytochrome b6-f complex iron-sulfur subunit